MRENKLSNVVWTKRYFDPTQKKDLLDYKFFLDNKKWSQNCPFILEWPFLNVQEMIRSKIIDTHFTKILENTQ